MSIHTDDSSKSNPATFKEAGFWLFLNSNRCLLRRYFECGGEEIALTKSPFSVWMWLLPFTNLDLALVPQSGPKTGQERRRDGTVEIHLPDRRVGRYLRGLQPARLHVRRGVRYGIWRTGVRPANRLRGQRAMFAGRPHVQERQRAVRVREGSVRSGSCSMQGRRLMHHAWCRVRRRMQAPALLWRRQRPSTGESGRRRRLPNVRIRWHDHHYLKHTSRWSWRRGWRRRPRAVVLRQVRRTRLLRLRSVRRHLRRRPHLRLRRMDRDRRSRFVRRRRFRRRRRNRRFRRSNHQLE
mgnify:FL=1